MKIEMLMPQMGESITEATVARWLKKPGDFVQKDEIILEISTDKVDSEIPAPESGLLAEILTPEGALVPVKQVIAIIDTSASQSTTPAPKKESTQSKEGVKNGASDNVSSSTSITSSTSASRPVASETVDDNTNAFISPLVRNLAKSHNVSLQELEQISGSGTGGRVTKNDFLDYVNRKQNANKEPTTRTTNPIAGDNRRVDSAQKNDGASAISQGDWSPEGTRIIPMDRMRQAIAEHMVRSKHTSPHVYSVQEVDVSNIAKYRVMHKNSFSKSEGFNLSYTPFFLEAVVRGIQKFPNINCSVDEKSIVLKRHVNLGCAVALGTSGLIVPVIKKAEELSLVGIARKLNDLAIRARDKKLLPEDVAGGTFTVTNPGIFGTIIGTPIINQPQVAILCLGAIKKRPVVVDDMIAIREMCYLTLSYDHRVVDGSLSGSFLSFVTNYLENWDINQPLK